MNMLPITGDNGERLAEILPTVISHLRDASDKSFESALVIVVDGLGWFNLNARRGHARGIFSLGSTKINTVIPSTTAAALSTLNTGKLPGSHGLIGYKLKHPDLGVISSLSDWEQIADVREWQLQDTLFQSLHNDGFNPTVIARSSHAASGFTKAVLSGANYVGADTIERRFEVALEILRARKSRLVYLYIDELDRAGHKYGWQSNHWVDQLERVDAAVTDFLRAAPSNYGLILTADHGMIDIPEENHVLLDDLPGFNENIVMVAGEPRFRHLYLADSNAATELCEKFESASATLWALTREQAVATGYFGPVSEQVLDRVGEIVMIPKQEYALASRLDTHYPITMIGQHGGILAAEREIPVITAGAAGDLFS